MPQIGGKSAKKSSTITKRNFTVVIGSKEHGLYVSSSPSSAARKAVSKLCATDKKRKVSFHIREITQWSKKKTYGPYLGYIEKLAKPIELKGRVIKYKPVAKLSGKTGKKSVVKKGVMMGGGNCYKELHFTNKQTMDNIAKELKEHFGDYIEIIDYNYVNKSKTIYELRIRSNFVNLPEKIVLGEFKKTIDEKLKEILQKEPNSFTSDGWDYVTNGTTNNNLNN